MTNGINFSKVDHILEFLKEKRLVCVWDVCPLAARDWQWQVTWRQRVYPSQMSARPRHATAACNNSADRLAAVFSVILKSCNFVTLGQITVS